jgi:hypothetical protein
MIYRGPSFLAIVHRKKKVRQFPVPSRDVTTKLSLGGNNDVITELFLPKGGVWLVTSRLEKGNSGTFFYGVRYGSVPLPFLLSAVVSPARLTVYCWSSLLTEEKGGMGGEEGTKSYDDKKAWSSITH